MPPSLFTPPFTPPLPHSSLNCADLRTVATMAHLRNKVRTAQQLSLSLSLFSVSRCVCVCVCFLSLCLCVYVCSVHLPVMVRVTAVWAASDTRFAHELCACVPPCFCQGISYVLALCCGRSQASRMSHSPSPRSLCLSLSRCLCGNFFLFFFLFPPYLFLVPLVGTFCCCFCVLPSARVPKWHPNSLEEHVLKPTESLDLRKCKVRLCLCLYLCVTRHC